MTDTMATSLTPPGVRRGIGLALSGGGFRATLLHLGALRRLNELGAPTRVDTITSVLSSFALDGQLEAAPLAPESFADAKRMR
jgi:hypothetical protein